MSPMRKPGKRRVHTPGRVKPRRLPLPSLRLSDPLPTNLPKRWPLWQGRFPCSASVHLPITVSGNLLSSKPPPSKQTANPECYLNKLPSDSRLAPSSDTSPCALLLLVLGAEHTGSPQALSCTQASSLFANDKPHTRLA
jgi:hypothetical protein